MRFTENRFSKSQLQTEGGGNAVIPLKSEILKETIADPDRKEVQIDDLIFGYLLCKDLQIALEEELVELGFSKTIIDKLRDDILKRSVSERKRILSLPRELRKNRDENMFFSRQIRMLKETGDVKGFLDILRDVAIENKWTVGYHTSSSDIRPKDNGEWNVDGTEEDHRDGDLSMAYYSMTYRNLYRDGKGREKYIYLVRAEESHRNEGGWYRAPSLSIIHKVSLSNIERQLEVERNRYNKSKADLYKNKKAA